MRVVHLTPFYGPAREWGGPSQSVALLARALRQLGVDAVVVTTDARGARGLPRLPAGTGEIDGVPVSTHRSVGPRRMFVAPTMLAELRAEWAADLVHVHGLWMFQPALAYAARRAGGPPYVLSPRGSLQVWGLAQKAWKKRVASAVLVDRVVRGAALVHLTSDLERAELPGRFAQCPTTVVPNAADVEGLGAVPPARALPGGPRLLMLGRVHPVKGFDLALGALARVRASYPGVRLTIAGPDEGGELRRVRDRAGELGVAGAVHLAGDLSRAEVAAALEACDLLLSPSAQESFGLAVAEAAAAGRPVVTCDTVGVAPEIAEAGAGLVVPRSVAALADAIEVLAADPDRCAEMGARGRALARVRWSPEAVALRMRDAYARALAGPAS